MKNGFTLIELLAVIVILAIIALIATPIVLNIINDTKESATLRSADFYLDGLETSVALAVLNNEAIKDGIYNILETGEICLEYDIDNKCINKLEVDVKGDKPQSGSVTISSGSITDSSLLFGNNIVLTNPNGELALGDKNTEVKLAPGLYDENNNLLITWKNLISTEYESIIHAVYDEDDYFLGEVTSAILNVDENGVLTSAYDRVMGENYSSEYLAGKLVIDDSVMSIGEDAFASCESLTSITIPSSVKNTGDYAFYGCSSLTSITIPNSVTSIGDYLFEECGNLTTVIIEQGVRSIGDYAFHGCSSLTSITIPNSVTSIGYSAFDGCDSLSSITIPNSVTSIGDCAFSGCSSLTSIKVDENNAVYDSRENSNAIIETSTNTLISGCKDTIIPNSVTSIGDCAFSGCSSLTSITIPVSVTSIGYGAFYGCSSLATITIPNSVTSIGEWSFRDCSSLATINYTGTPAEWNAISKGGFWDSGTPSNKVINYNYAG